MVQIQELVYTKLSFLVNDTPTDNKIDLFAKEIMYMLQNCLKIADAGVEDESAYTFMQLSLISDLVCIKLLNTKAVQDMASSSSGDGGTYLKKAKAGSAEAEFDSIPKEGRMYSSVSELFKEIKAEALSKASQYGCMIPMITDQILQPTFSPPFIVVPDSCR